MKVSYKNRHRRRTKIWHTPEFLKLQKEWYDKLKSTTFSDGSTFHDIEYHTAPGYLWGGRDWPPLKGPSQRQILAYWQTGTANYLDLLHELTYKEGFLKTEKHREMWRLYTEVEERHPGCGHRKGIYSQIQDEIERIWGKRPAYWTVVNFVRRTKMKYNALYADHFPLRTSICHSRYITYPERVK